jgi:hypothetical protein
MSLLVEPTFYYLFATFIFLLTLPFMKKLFLPLLIVAFGLQAHYACAQTKQSTYNHHAAFAPEFFATGGNLFRSADGTPGPSYWQNEADYTITAKLDTASKTINGEVQITYTNNSPNNLNQLWLQLVHNSKRSHSIAAAVQGFRRPSSGKRGFHLHKVRVRMGRKWIDANYVVHGTTMQIRLPQTLKAKGTSILNRKSPSIQIDISYDLTLPESGRSSYVDTKNGAIYDVSYWYPRLCVYDDIRGWNTLPFLGEGEFYLDYGTIDYKVTLPTGMLMAGNGRLMNPKQTLTDKEYKRYQKAHHTGKSVIIRREEELDQPTTAKGKDGWVTWHYHMEHTRDVAWAASKAFIWDAATATYNDGKNSAFVESFYPAEAAGKKRWGRDTQYLKFDIEYFSNQWMPYPYATAVSVGGGTGGMEFPGLAFDGFHTKGYSTFFLITHEIGHTWFPMIVGSNERVNAWMD